MKKLHLCYNVRPRGYLVLVMAIMIVIVGFVCAAVANMYFGSLFASTAHLQSNAALYLAESGLEHATHMLLNPTAANRLTCVGYNTTPITNTLGAGGYSATSSGSPTYASSPTTLSSAMTATSTSIPVASTSNYPSSGRVMVDKEEINYASTTTTAFNDLTRSADGTIAVAHAAGAVVSQYQCTLTAKGGVPSIAASQGKRTVQAAVQLQEGFAVANTSASKYTIFRFNNPVEKSWSQLTGTASPAVVNFYGVFLNSYSDGWFVGASYAEHWLGGTNTFYASPGGLAVNFRSVYCLANNSCYAVGSNTGIASTSPSIIYWNGSTWTKQTSASNNEGNNLYSVNCSASNNCWAVGDIGTGSLAQGYRFYLWNGTNWAGYTISNASLTAAFPFQSVFCNAATDCWAVGLGSNFARLTSGTAWTPYASGMPSVQYNSVFCNTTSDCWAVGATSAGNVFVHWNGTAWSRDTSYPTPLANLTSVACTNNQDCWAVGPAVATNQGTFFHWDGTSWTNWTAFTNGPVNTATVNAVAIVGPNTQPITAWSEVIP